MKSNDEDCVVFEAGGEVEEPDILFSDKGASWLPTADSLSQLQSTFLSLPVPVPQTNVLRHLVIDIWSHLQSIYIIYVQSIIVSNHFKMYCTYHLLATETFLLLYVYIYTHIIHLFRFPPLWNHPFPNKSRSPNLAVVPRHQFFFFGFFRNQRFGLKVSGAIGPRRLEGGRDINVGILFNLNHLYSGNQRLRNPFGKKSACCGDC